MTRARRHLAVSIALAVACMVLAAHASATTSATIGVTVLNGVSAPTLVSPSAAAVTGTTPTLVATHTDPEGDTGTLTFQVCPDAACTTVARTGSSAAGLGIGTNGSWIVSPALTSGPWYWRAGATDLYGDTSGWTTTRSFSVNADTDQPTAAPVIVPATGAQYQYVVPGTVPRVWINTAFAGTFVLKTNAADVTSNVQRVEFPDPLVAGWTPAGPTTVYASPWEQTYGWTAGSNDLGSRTFIVYDNSPAANSATASFEAVRDTDDPTGGFLTVPAGATAAPSVSISFARGTDGSGSGTAIHALQRASATYSGGTCGTYGGFVDVSAAEEVSPYADAGITADGCYMYQLLVTDHVGNTQTISSGGEVRVDRTAPTGSIDAIGPISGTVTLSGTIADAASEPSSASITYDNGTQSGTICAAPTLVGGGTSRTWTCVFDTAALGIIDGPVTVKLTGYDTAGNAITPAVTRSILVDNQGPAITTLAFAPQSGTANQYAANCALPCTPRLYVQPMQSGTVNLTIGGADAGSVVASATFPDFDGAATAWTPSGSTLVTGADPYTTTYGFTGPGVTALGTLQVMLTDSAGASSTATVEVLTDATAPTGTTIANPPAYRNVLSVPVTVTVGSDGGGSGVAGTLVQRQAATLSGGICGTFAGWAPVTLVGGADTSVASDMCYHYRATTKDNVGNGVPTAQTSNVMVDTTAPIGSIVATPIDPWRGTIAVTGTSGDTTTGVANVSLAYAGPPSGTPCLMSATTWSTTGCSFATAGLADGSYVLTATITDLAGNVQLATRTVTLDNAAPLIAAAGTTEPAGAAFQYTSGSTTYVNPAGSGTLRIQFSATDAGSGVSTVGVPPIGGGWTPAVGTVSPPSSYSFDFAFAAPVSGAGTFLATATDNAGSTATTPFTIVLDAAAPTGGAISYPSGVGATPTITVMQGTDAASGLRDWNVERRAVATTGPGTCGTFGASWTAVGSPSPIGSMVDTTVQPSTCYQYRLAVADNVDNVAYFTSAATFITPTPSVVVTPVGTSSQVTERGTATSWTVVLTAAPSAPTRVDITGGALLSLPITSVTFDALDWYLPKTITATAVDDAVDTTPDSVIVQVAHTVTSGDPAYLALAPTKLPVTVTDDDVAGVVASAATLGVAEHGTAASFDVRLATRPVGTVTVTTAADSGEASASPTALTFDASNWNVPQVVSVAAVDDPDVDGTTSTRITATSSSTADAAYGSLAITPVSVSVTDDDQARLVIDSSDLARISEAKADVATTVTARLAARPSADVRVAPTVPNGDVRVPSGAMTFTRSTWNTPQTVRILPVDDPVSEASPHTGRIVFATSSDDATFGAIPDRALGIEVTDDDPARFLQRPGDGWTTDGDGVIALTEAGEQTATVSIVADGDPSRSIRLEPVISSEADVRVNPTSATIDPAAPDTAHTFTFTAIDDGRAEDAIQSVRVTWKVTTIDPMYADTAIAAAHFGIADHRTAAAPAPTPTPDATNPARGIL